MTADPRSAAKWHRRFKWVWIILMVPAGIAFFVLDFETFASISLLVTVELTLYDTFLGHAASEQGAESRFPEEESEDEEQT